jgi:hypothetical protein
MIYAIQSDMQATENFQDSMSPSIMRGTGGSRKIRFTLGLHILDANQMAERIILPYKYLQML